MDIGRDRSDDIDNGTEGAENRHDESDIIADKDETTAKSSATTAMRSIERDKPLSEEFEEIADLIDDDIDIDETGDEGNISI
jgi:hypothetical protein